MRSPRLAGLFALVALLAAAGCGPRKHEPEVTFETLEGAPDTAGLSQGDPLFERFEASRSGEGAVTLAGRIRLPEGTRLQLTVKAPGGTVALAMAHVLVREGRFESGPLFGESGPLPVGRYRLELLAQFTPDWQTTEVLRATGDGMRLRGPGITRGRDGRAVLFLTREDPL